MNVSQFFQSQLIQTLLATIVGGVIVILSNGLNARGRRKQDIKDWFERTYITEGIDPLVAYYESLIFSIFNKADKHITYIAKRDIPSEAIGRIYALINDPSPHNIILAAHSHLAYTRDQHLLYEVGDAMLKPVQALLKFRLELTRAISGKVHDKYYEPDTSELVNQLKEASNELDRLASKRDEEEQKNFKEQQVIMKKLHIPASRRNDYQFKRRKAP